MRLNEFNRYSRLAIRALGMSLSHSQNFNLLSKRIYILLKRCYSRRNYRFAFEYLKACSLFVHQFLAGNHGLPLDSFGPRVALDFRGLPKIIPMEIRIAMLDWHDNFESSRGIIGCVLTLLSTYRILPYRGVIDYNSIVSPFSGVSQSFDLHSLKESISMFFRLSSSGGLGAHPLRSKKWAYHSEKSGPNFGPATQGCWKDAFAFIHDPVRLFHTLRMYLLNSNYILFV